MSQVYKHAQRYELIDAAIDSDGRPTNPVVLVRAESGSRYEAVVISPEQIIVILNELDSPQKRLEWTLVLVHASTALRPEEAFGLKWQDVDWHNGQIKICRGWSKGKETPGKTVGSMTQVAMHPALAQALLAWRQESRYSHDEDWVFAFRQVEGKNPSIRRCRRPRLSHTSSGQSRGDSEGIQGEVRVAQSSPLTGHVSRDQ